MSQEMKLIMENWREKTLLMEYGLEDEPATWGVFKAMLKAMIGAKQGLLGQALASASGLTALFGAAGGEASDAVQIANAIAGMISESENNPNKTSLEEAVVTMGAVLLGLKVIGGIGAGKKALGFLQGAYRKLRGRPTDKTDNNPFLDMLNLDPEYAKMLDDRLEEQFLKWWLEQIQGKDDNDEIDSTELDVNAKMQEFLKLNFDDHTVTGHTEPSTAGGGFKGTTGDVKQTRSKVRSARAKRAAGMQV